MLNDWPALLTPSSLEITMGTAKSQSSFFIPNFYPHLRWGPRSQNKEWGKIGYPLRKQSEGMGLNKNRVEIELRRARRAMLMIQNSKKTIVMYILLLYIGTKKY